MDSRSADPAHEVLIRLFEWPVPVLIIGASTGVRFISQTGGHACHQHSMEGLAIPAFSMRVADHSFDCEAAMAHMLAHFTGEKYRGWCSDGIDEATADFVELALASAWWPSWRVDRSRLGDSEEAWVWVRGSGESDPTRNTTSDVTGLPTTWTGAVTWPNSD